MTDPAKTVSVQLTPITSGFPNIHDDKYASALSKAKEGGGSTQQWFDAQNQTSDFWGWMADHTGPNDNPFAPAVDPQGNPIQIASNGNVDMRNGAFFRAVPHEQIMAAIAAGDPAPIVGIGTIQTHNTTSEISRTISFGLGLVGIPPGIILTKKLFADLLSPVYKNFKTWVTKMSDQFKKASQVESPDIDPEAEDEGPIGDATDEIGDVGGELAAEGAEYLAVDWGSVALEAAGLGVIAAIPLLVSYLGHKMVNSVEIHNLTNLDFTWSVLDQEWGKASIMPKQDKGGNILPKMDYNTDSWGDKTTVKVAYSADFQFINSNDYGSIGYVLGLTPSDNSTPAKAVVSIPWAGDNTIWVGQSNDTPQNIYLQHSNPDGKLSVVANFGSYQITWSINALSGETEGAYFYGILGVIEPTS
jgi:hypothetical protein